MKIFVTGLTSSAKGGMQFHNLGNYIITEPLFQKLRESFPDGVISTGMQLSEDFYKRFDVVHLQKERFFTYGLRTGIATAFDILRVLFWKLTKINSLLSTPLLSELASSDLVIDFSGDIYGDNANWRSFLETNARLWFALMMKKKTAMIIGSPGPFSSFWRQWLAKQILPRLSLITNRESLSTTMLSYIGIKGNHIHTTACPSVLFESASKESMRACEDFSVIFEDKRPTIGLILCGWNMPKGPYNRWPREDWEFKSFIQLVSHLKKNTGYRICLMSHQNSTTSAGLLCKGNDHRILEKLIELLGDVYDGEQVFTLKGLYDAAQSKAIIGQFDLLVSGRIHGAVQGLSQCIPVVILDYGHEPKAHKLIGFSMVYDIVNFVVDPRDGDNLCNKVEEVIARKEMLADHIKSRLPMIVAKANLNFALLKAL